MIISDLHLGSSICRDEAIIEFLDSICRSDLSTRRLILNGDVFDSIDFRRLRKGHWKVLSLIRRLSDRINIVWVCGNHDGPSEIISHLLGVEAVSEYSFESNSRSILILHGDRFDDFIDTHPRITFAADLLYRFMQRIDRTHRFAGPVFQQRLLDRIALHIPSGGPGTGAFARLHRKSRPSNART